MNNERFQFPSFEETQEIRRAAAAMQAEHLRAMVVKGWQALTRLGSSRRAVPPTLAGHAR
ncbi:hypothetical protein HL658_07730 [Azospirillum sp. RWY-5-1]|uniref:Uncharacterized protein n=1 Tax=Azospirillum oleiclasticum TaxID=2735135 RepID=A0ABX2T8N5_9PROT|nr:hypothetical protein [Azospirillum oleiclasticum]NYZ12436.1 hypothetical protein [Azospirillum oleiclasticum]NYZ19596.1 hypothetical protein [Azospirillum oleiclasticum]